MTSFSQILFLIFGYFGLAHALFHPIPHATIVNTEPVYSLLNSIDFHPKEPIFCVTYTHNNKICFYKIDKSLQPHLIQTLKGPSARLKEPQHAVFSPSGEMLVVANWTNQSLNVYLRKSNGFFEEEPISSIFFPKALDQSKPHGIAFSPSGQYLAVACGASTKFKTGLVLFEKRGYHLEPVSILEHDQLRGIPKGICFAPDGECLLVTFSGPSSLAVFQLNGGKIDRFPKQIIEGAHTQLSRPEDIKISPDGTYCAVSNSDKNTITFYRFDKNTNTIDEIPFWSLGNPEAHFTFPHGLAFSSDGSYLAVTQFGQIKLTPEGKIIWQKGFLPREGAINIYRNFGENQ
ncbi:MAG TPA: beta-propeller fold lactonase family protein [Rhabdochlamydiaceae bacterium]|jgi:6-phosphogluconolactonase (cycloisomerase 2 family)